MQLLEDLFESMDVKYRGPEGDQPGGEVIIPMVADDLRFDIRCHQTDPLGLCAFFVTLLRSFADDLPHARDLSWWILGRNWVHFPYGRLSVVRGEGKKGALVVDTSVPKEALTAATTRLIVESISAAVKAAVAVFESVVPKEDRGLYSPAYSHVRPQDTKPR